MGITDLMVGGMGTLGKAVGEGVEGYLTERDLNSLRSVNPAGAGGGQQGQDPMVQQVLELARQGVDPRTAVQHIMEQRKLGVRGVNQPQIVPQSIGPSAQMPMPGAGGGLGSLGAQPPAPPQANPQQPYQTVGQTSPAMERMFAAVDESRSTPRQPGMIPGDQTVEEYPQTPVQGRPQNRIGQTQSTQSPAQPPAEGPLAGFGVSGRITQRNLPLAQLMMQQRSKEAASEARLGGIERQLQVRQEIEADKEAGKDRRQAAALANRAEIAQLDSDTRTQLGQLKNDTDIFRVLQQRAAAMAAIGQRAAQSGDELEFKREKSGSDGELVKALTKVYTASMQSAAALPTGERKAAEEKAGAMYQQALKQIYGMELTGGGETTTVTPGFFGGTAKTEKIPFGAKGPTKGAAPTPAKSSAQGKKVVKTQTNAATGQKRIIYDDGSVEVK